jgi:hypothetical protein
MLQFNSGLLIVMGYLLGWRINRWWRWMPLIVGVFLLQHSTQGWCPPLGLWRRLGFRTSTEIHAEEMALKLIRGDLDRVLKAMWFGEEDRSRKDGVMEHSDIFDDLLRACSLHGGTDV